MKSIAKKPFSFLENLVRVLASGVSRFVLFVVDLNLSSDQVSKILRWAPHEGTIQPHVRL